MNYDALTMAAVADELRAKVLGGWVQKVVLPAELALGLGIYSHHQMHWLLLSAHPQEARAHLISERLARTSDEVSPLLLLARKHIRDQRLVAVEQMPHERVLTLTIGDCRLVIEVMGRHSNILLLDGEGLILDSVKRIGPSLSRQRIVLPHQPYTPPPAQTKAAMEALQPSDLEGAFREAEPRAPGWQVLVGSVAAVSPTMAREIIHRATGDASMPARAVDSAEVVLRHLRDLSAGLRTGQWKPSVAVQGEAVVAFAPYILTHLPGARLCQSISEALESFYTQSERLKPLEQARSRLQAIVVEGRRPRQRRLESLQRQMLQAEQAEELRWRGQMLLAFGPGLRPSQATLEVEGRQIPIDPRLSWLENAQACFRDYERARGALNEVPSRLAETRQELEYLDQLATYVSLAESVEELRRLEAELEQALPGAQARVEKTGQKAGMSQGKRPRWPAGRPKMGRAHGRQPQPYAVSPEGYDIYVGRSGLDNEAVTFQISRPDDLWLHARGVPGAHVIVRGGLEEVPAATLQQAARLAARFSQASEAGKVEVDYTARKHVRKIKGAPPGMVTYSHERTLLVEPAKGD